MKKKIALTFTILAGLCLILGIGYLFYQEGRKENKQKQQKELEAIIKEIDQDKVKTKKQIPLYQKSGEIYQEIGSVAKDVILELNKEETVTKEHPYFPLKNSDYYISYQHIEPTEEEIKKDQRYQNYIPFNETVTTKNKTDLYQNGNLIYSIQKELSFPIIIKEEESYFVEFDQQLFEIKKENTTITTVSNTEQIPARQIATIVYHFVYDPEQGEVCDQIICHTTKQVRSHLEYLKQEQFFTLQMKEMDLFVSGKIQLPQKSVLITEDDGWFADRGVALFNEYQMNATVFLITDTYNKEQFQSEYVETHSHGDHLHYGGECPGGQGGPIKCYPKHLLLEDLRKSRAKLDNSTVFCYPFYEYNDYAIDALKEAGFTMAFAGGNRKVKVGDNKMILPRITLNSSTTVEDLKRIVG